MKAFLSENPLKSIFKLSSKGNITEELESLNKIDSFFKYLKDEKIPSKLRCQVIEELIKKLKINRYLCEYFSSYQNQSIYIFLSQLYIDKSTSKDLKLSIINLINELRINLDINKNIYDYIFQKISAIYREEEKLSQELLYNYLILLHTFLGDTINHLKPRNYFCCSGEGCFEIDLSKLQLKMGCSFTFIINFRIGSSILSLENPEKGHIANLISVKFTNGYKIDFDLQYPIQLIVKEIQDKFIKTLPADEWINLIINVVNDDKNNTSVFFFANGENRLIPFQLKKAKLTSKDTFESIKFFNNFYGEVSSITFLSQKDYGYPGANASDFLLEFKQFKEGLWKKKKIETFLKLMNEFDSIGIEKTKSKTFSKKAIKMEKRTDRIERETNGKLIDNIIFIFTPLNYYENNKNIIENVIGLFFLKLKFSGNIRPHKYQCLQKRIGNLGLISNLLPIAEMFVIHPELLNEDNFEIFLKIIKEILNNRKDNMKIFSDGSFFQILSLFIEKYQKNVFTEKILNTFAEIGKCMFGNDEVELSTIYFDNILLNEKILSKYSEELQIKFWNHILLFWQSDSQQIEIFINMNRICLILRFYDRNKYTEMCCKKHLSMIKDEFKGNTAIMNPPMNEKLKIIENIMNVIINAQEPEKAFYLFKLLTLDLSPCLTEFILNIFLKALMKESKDKKDIKWKENFINVLLNNKFETIFINTFVHCLPEIKISLLKLLFEIFKYSKLIKPDKFKNLTRTIRELLLPQDNFYSEKIVSYNKIPISGSINVYSSNSSNKPSLEIPKANNNQQKKNLDKKANIMEIKKQILNANKNAMLKPIKKEENFKKGSGNINKKDDSKKPINLGHPSKFSSMISKLEGMGEKIPGFKGQRPSAQFKPKDAKDALSKSVLITSENPSNKNNTILNKSINEGNRPITSTKSNTIVNSNISVNKKEDSNFKSKYKLKLKNEDDELIIIKEKIFCDYIEELYKFLLLCTFNLPSNSNIEKIDFKNNKLESKPALELLLCFAYELNDIEFNLQCIKIVEKISELPLNAYRLVEHEKIIPALLDIAYNYFKSTDKKEQKCFEMIKTVILNIYLNSIIHLEKTHSLYPCDKIETILLWGDKMLFNQNSGRNYKDTFLDFMTEFLFEILTGFKIKYETLMDLNLTKSTFNFNPGANFYLKNYFILITHLFRFSFNYKHDTIIRTEGLTFIGPSPKVNNYLLTYITGMKMDPLKGVKIAEQWTDYPFFDEIYKKIGVVWTKIRNFKMDKKKSKNKDLKYQQILEKVILDKDHKNIYQKELELLCFEEIIGEREQIMPLIKIIPIEMMCIIHYIETEAEFLKWLKEFKRFIRFVIIGSSNLIRTNQLELYNQIQEKCINVIISAICFLKELLDTSSKCKPKIEKSLISILLLCSLIVGYQYNYINKHKGLKSIKIPGKPSRNDLLQCSVFIIFSEIIKNKSGVALLDQKEIDSLATSPQYARFIQLLETKEWKEGLLENDAIRLRISNDFFALKNYKKIVDHRMILVKYISNDKDERYKDEILSLLPLYEQELLKYSNNSLEKNKKIKNIYKRLKKYSFAWYGYWSDRKLFFHDYEKLKLKLMNHLTKNLMKPVLVPILDMAYYLPEFSGFNPSTLFNRDKDSTNSKFKLIMDIDKILKSSEQSNIKEIKKNLSAINEENFLRKIYMKSNPELAESLKKIADNLDFGKEEEFAIIQKENDPKKKKEVKKYYLSCLVKTSHHIKGVCFIEEKNLNFKVFLNQRTGNAMSGIEIGFTTKDDDYDQERQTCFGSYFICRPKDGDLYKISINYSDIKWVFRRRYYYLNSALEIFTTTNKTFYFNFKYEKEREDVLNQILSKLTEPAKIVDDLKDPKDIFENVIGYENVMVTDTKKKGKKIKLSKRIEMWKEWKMTNYELLMWLNIYGNRSFNDISQYPVFPWVLSSYKDPLKHEKNEKDEEYNLRDMSLPMGMMALDEKGEQRKELFMINFDTLKQSDEEGIKPYFYGSNYSNPIYVCNYLMRIFPFTHIAIELQGSKFDQPDRLFLSVENSFYNSVTQKTDVRELIPEFFYLPEIFLNINNLNMGVLENGKKVHDILTPCHNNPFEFVLIMRTVLESNEVSNSIQNWIDLIFGSKARGKEAEIANNLFTEASYQENLDIKKVENKESTLRMVEFGLIPTQIMSKDCPKREKKEDLIKGREITDKEAYLIIYECKPAKDQPLYSNNFKDYINVLVGGEFSQDKITLALNNNIIIEKKINNAIFEKKMTEDVVNYYPLQISSNKMGKFFHNDSNKKVFQFMNKGKILIMGGFYDGKILINHIEEKTKEVLIPFNDDCPILSLHVSQDEEYLLVGNSKGNVAVYKIDVNLRKWHKIKIIPDQKSPISHVYCNSDLNLWVSTSIDGFVNLYTLPLCKLARTIKVSSKNCSYSFLTSSPLPSIVVINDEENSEIIVYSLNGKVIYKHQLYFNLKNPIIIRDLNSNEYLAYVGKDAITIHILPTLEVLVHKDITPKMEISSIFTSEDKKALYCINKSGSNVYVIREEIKKNLRNASIALMNL